MPNPSPLVTRPAPIRSRGLRTSPWAVVVALVVALLAGGATSAQALAAPTASASASDETSVSWSARPADTAQGAGRPNFAYELLPGATLSDGILVTNLGAGTISLEVYAADGFLTADGSLDLLAGGEDSTELGSWIDLDAASVTLGAGESAEVPFEITVPSTVQPGDYAAGVVASMSVESDTGVVTERRLGSRMHVRIAGDLAPAVTVTDLRVDYRGTPNPVGAGAATVTFTLTNTGNTRIAPHGDVVIAGPWGVAATTVGLGDVPELLPGSSLERTLPIDAVPPLFLTTADLSVGADIVERPGALETDAPPVTAVSASAVAWTVPWTALGIAALVIALVVWRILAGRRAKARHRREVDDAVAAALAAREESPIPVERV